MNCLDNCVSFCLFILYQMLKPWITTNCGKAQIIKDINKPWLKRAWEPPSPIHFFHHVRENAHVWNCTPQSMSKLLHTYFLKHLVAFPIYLLPPSLTSYHTCMKHTHISSSHYQADFCFYGSCESESVSHSCVQLFATLWTVAHQPPLSMGFSRQEYWRE